MNAAQCVAGTVEEKASAYVLMTVFLYVTGLLLMM